MGASLTLGMYQDASCAAINPVMFCTAASDVQFNATQGDNFSFAIGNYDPASPRGNFWLQTNCGPPTPAPSSSPSVATSSPSFAPSFPTPAPIASTLPAFVVPVVATIGGALIFVFAFVLWSWCNKVEQHTELDDGGVELWVGKREGTETGDQNTEEERLRLATVENASPDHETIGTSPASSAGTNNGDQEGKESVTEPPIQGQDGQAPVETRSNDESGERAPIGAGTKPDDQEGEGAREVTLAERSSPHDEKGDAGTNTGDQEGKQGTPVLADERREGGQNVAGASTDQEGKEGASGTKGRQGRQKVEVPYVPFSEIRMGSELGSGAFGSVNECVWNGADHAIKQLHTVSPQARAEFEKEILINTHLLLTPHPCVVRMICVVDSPRALVMELYPLKSLEHYLIREGHLDEEGDFVDVLTILVNASAGVLHLHRQGVIHRDIAARNFLLNEGLSVAVCDFGLALFVDKSGKGIRSEAERRADILPINTSSPETLSAGEYSYASDVYMFGLFIWEVFARAVPFGDRAELKGQPQFARLAQAIQAGDRPELPSSWPPALGPKGRES